MAAEKDDLQIDTVASRCSLEAKREGTQASGNEARRYGTRSQLEI